MAALIFGEQHGKLDIVLRGHGSLNSNGRGNLQPIHLRNRIYDPIGYPLLSPYGSEKWHSLLRYTDSKGKLLKVSPMKYY